jgi:hypothetical protein
MAFIFHKHKHTHTPLSLSMIIIPAAPISNCNRILTSQYGRRLLIRHRSSTSLIPSILFQTTSVITDTSQQSQRCHHSRPTSSSCKQPTCTDTTDYYPTSIISAPCSSATITTFTYTYTSTTNTSSSS